MSNEFWTAFFLALPLTIASVGTFIISWRTSTKTNKISLATTEIAATSAVLVQKTDEIHQLANSNLTAQTNALAVANERIEGLRTLVETGNNLSAQNGHKISVAKKKK